MPQNVVEDLKPRLESAGNAVRDARVALRLRTKALNKLVVQAADEGMAHRAIAAAAGYASAGRITAILAESGDDD